MKGKASLTDPERPCSLADCECGEPPVFLRISPDLFGSMAVTCANESSSFLRVLRLDHPPEPRAGWRIPVAPWEPRVLPIHRTATFLSPYRPMSSSAKPFIPLDFQRLPEEEML